MNEKIRLTIPSDLLTAIQNAKLENETVDECLERYIKLGMQIEGKL